MGRYQAQGVVALLTTATTVSNGALHEPQHQQRTFDANGSTSSGAGSATILIQASNDGSNFILIATITLTLSTTPAADGFASDAPWKYVRARVSAISGTGASVNVNMGC
jgi:hypothetical protein